MSRRNAAHIANDLRSRLVIEAGAAGRQLPTERDLASQLNASRNTVRKALKLLEEEGLLIRRHGSGTFLQPQRGSEFRGPNLDTIFGASPADVLDVRLLMEPSIAAMAATRASEKDLQAIEHAHLQAIAAPALDLFERWDSAFHQAIIQAAHNELLIELMMLVNSVRMQPRWKAMKRHADSEELRRNYCVQHGNIVDAMLKRDPARARGAMVDHLNTVRQSLTFETPREPV